MDISKPADAVVESEHVGGQLKTKTPNVNLLSYFFCKKIPLSRCVEYVMDGSVDESVSQ